MQSRRGALYLNILLNGATGKVGRCIEALAADDPELAIVGRGCRDEALPYDVDADVVIDFSRPESMLHVLDVARRLGLPLVCGTTGLQEPHAEALKAAAAEIPVFHAANFSIGIHVLDRLVREAAVRLGEAFDIEIVETHHRHKVDAPSGTALLLGQSIADRLGLNSGNAIVTDGHEGAGRRAGRIGIQSLRGGDVIGEHDVRFLGDGERLELIHRATDRSLFARGALRAALWLVGRPPGRYGMDDLVDAATGAGSGKRGADV